jgi:hypothetical protein
MSRISNGALRRRSLSERVGERDFTAKRLDPSLGLSGGKIFGELPGLIRLDRSDRSMSAWPLVMGASSRSGRRW